MTTKRVLRQLMLLLRQLLSLTWSFSWWLTAGLRKDSTRSTGLRLLALGLAIGALIGWSNGKVIHIVNETELPRPVTPPPPGMAWARAMTTGYCPCWRCCGMQADGHTSTRRDVRQHPYGIAVDSGLLPNHTSLLVPGYGLAEADDTGGAMRQHAREGLLHIDLRFKTHDQAARWGVRWMWLAVPAGAKAGTLPRAQR
jgi:3D (Asp-Asp-Asp) domain-containing protein